MNKLVVVTFVAFLALAAAANAAVNWEYNYKAALAKAKREKKLVMVDMYADWCGPCKLLDKNTFSNKDVETKLSNDFVAVKIDLEKSKEAQELARQFGADEIPHIIFVGPDGKKLSDHIGYVTADEFLKQLEIVRGKATKK